VFWAKINASRRGNQLFHAWNPEAICRSTKGEGPKVQQRAKRPFKSCRLCIKALERVV
jgi:hypothetical protein